MNENFVTGIVTVVVGIIGLASLAVILSPKASTANVIQAASSGLALNLTAATNPFSGGGGGFGGFTGGFGVGNGGY